MKTIATKDAGWMALDWAVAQIQGVKARIDLKEGLVVSNLLGWFNYTPSRSWAQGGEIIEREGIELLCESLGFRWVAMPQRGPEWRGPTPLIAAMRCFVASRLGDTIEVPEELA